MKPLGKIVIAICGAWWVAAAWLAVAMAQPTFSAGEGSTVAALNLSSTIQTVFTVPSGSRRLWTGVHLVNSGAAACYMQWFDAVSATLGTTVPKWPIMVPPANGLFLGTYDYSFSQIEAPFFVTGMIAYGTTTATGAATCPLTGAVFYR